MRKLRINSLLQLGVLILIAAIALYIYMTFFMLTYDKINKNPLNIPIELTDGSLYQGTFSPNYSFPYYLGIQLDTELSDDDLKKLFDEEDISIKWSLASDGDEIYSNTIKNNKFSHVHLLAGYEYTLNLNVVKGSSRINELSPVIRIFTAGTKGLHTKKELIIRTFTVACFITAGGLFLLSGIFYLLNTMTGKPNNRISIE